VRLWSLQILRFWAALAVCVLHASAVIESVGVGPSVLPASVLGAMPAGADVFFVLSGVIIALTAPGLSATTFAIRRARRIFPMWWMVGVPTLAVMALTAAPDWRLALSTLTLWPVTDRVTAPITVGWTLCFEALFYAAAALVLWRPRALWVLLAAYLVALLLRAPFIGSPLILEFLLGVLVARLPRWRPAMWLIPAGVALLVLASPHVLIPLDASALLSGENAWRRALMFGLPSAGIVWGTMQLRAKAGALSRLGDASYALYVLHVPLLAGFAMLAARLASGAPPDVLLALIVAASVLLTWRVHVLFEKPILAFLNRRWPAPATA
jgi:exopolysaccharide production protein ExoZ